LRLTMAGYSDGHQEQSAPCSPQPAVRSPQALAGEVRSGSRHIKTSWRDAEAGRTT
jgi:hypothetical protein